MGGFVDVFCPSFDHHLLFSLLSSFISSQMVTSNAKQPAQLRRQLEHYYLLWRLISNNLIGAHTVLMHNYLLQTMTGHKLANSTYPVTNIKFYPFVKKWMNSDSLNFKGLEGSNLGEIPHNFCIYFHYLIIDGHYNNLIH